MPRSQRFESAPNDVSHKLPPLGQEFRVLHSEPILRQGVQLAHAAPLRLTQIPPEIRNLFTRRTSRRAGVGRPFEQSKIRYLIGLLSIGDSSTDQPGLWEQVMDLKGSSMTARKRVEQ